MDPLRTISNEVHELHSSIAALDDALLKIEHELSPCRDRSATMVSDILQALNGVTGGLPERRQALDKVGYEIDQASSSVRELTARGGKIGQSNLLTRQKERLVELRHVLRDLSSDLEAIESFELNFKARSARLKESE